MALQHLTFDLRDFEFPFLSRQKGGGAYYEESASSPNYKPRVSWMSNLWPISQGKYSAVTTRKSGLLPVPPATLATLQYSGVRIYTVLKSNQRTYLLLGSSEWWIWSGDTWKLIHTSLAFGNPSVFSLKAQTYIVSPGEGVYAFDPTSPFTDFFGTVLLQVLTGVTGASMVAGCAALSYMILADGDTIYWSSPLNPLYFSPGGAGSDYGAGSTKALGIQSPITYLVGTETGFYIFTEANVIQAVYSGNPDSPWNLQVVDNSSGALSLNYIIHQDTLQSTFYWSESGLALLGDGQCKYIASEITELLAGDLTEDYNPVSHSPDIFQAKVTYDLQLSFLGNRYLAISYGVADQQRTKILIYDTVLDVWFRLAFPHLALTELISVSSGGLIFDNWTDSFWDTEITFSDMMDTTTNKQTNTIAIGLLSPDGQIYRLSPVRVGVTYPGETVVPNQICLEDIRMSKSQMSELHEVCLAFSYPTYPSTDGLAPNADPIGPGQVWAKSIQSPTPRQFLVGYADGAEQRWVQRVQGQRLSVSLENIGSITSLTFGLRGSGRRFK